MMAIILAAGSRPGTRKMDDSTEELFSCKLCFELFNDPVMLPCGHSMCFSCTERPGLQTVTAVPPCPGQQAATNLEEAGAAGNAVGTVVACATCGQAYPRCEWPRNRDLRDVVDAFRAKLHRQNRATPGVQAAPGGSAGAAEQNDGAAGMPIAPPISRRTPCGERTAGVCKDIAVARCRECDMCYCGACWDKLHVRGRAGHIRRPLGVIDLMCSEHEHTQPAVLYCIQDAAHICLLCNLHGRHKGHKVVEAADNANAARADVQAAAVSASSARDELLGLVQLLTQRLDDLTAEKTRTEGILRNFYQRCADSLRRGMANVEQAAGELAAARDAHVGHQRDALLSAAEEWSRVKSEATGVLASVAYPRVLAERDRLATAAVHAADRGAAAKVLPDRLRDHADATLARHVAHELARAVLDGDIASVQELLSLDVRLDASLLQMPLFLAAETGAAALFAPLATRCSHNPARLAAVLQTAQCVSLYVATKKMTDVVSAPTTVHATGHAAADALWQGVNPKVALGIMHLIGDGVPASEQAAASWFQRAAAEGCAFGQYALGCCYENGWAVAKDLATACALYQQSADTGLAIGQNNVGRCYELGMGVSLSDAEAYSWYLRAATQDNPNGQNNVGRCFENGCGVARDAGEAFRWYCLAACQGLPEAQNNVGRCYERGSGVEADAAMARAWYLRAAEQGLPVAQNNAGRCYEHGLGAPADVHEAYRWYKRAAEQGLAIGQNNVGLCYEHGRGVAVDMAEAYVWYRRAADQGYVNGLLNVGRCFHFGMGVATDLTQARRWYGRAADRGSARAAQLLASLH